MDKKTLLIIDSHALIHRAYHAFPPSLKTTKGESVNAVYGFAGLLLDVLMKFNPSHVVAVFDSHGPTVRSVEYTQYKANRSETDELLVSQFPRVYELVDMFDIPKLMLEGIEADDIIGTVDKRHSGNWARTIVVTGDRDLFQLVDEDTFVYLAGSKFSESKLFDAAMVKEKMGVTPEQIPDLKGLSGDASDNIPGVRGIGPKGASELIAEFGTVENIYANLDKVNKRYQQKLIDGQESAYLSKKLATIDRDIPISFDFEQSDFSRVELPQIRNFFQEMQFRSLNSRLESFAKKFEVQNTSLTLFDEAVALENKEALISEQWNKKAVDEDKIYFLCEYFNLELSPINWKISTLFFTTDSKKVFAVSMEDLKSFLDLNSEKDFVTFDKKKFMHSFFNEFEKFPSIKVSDLGISAYLISQGRVKFEIKSALTFYGIEYSDNLLVNLTKLAGLDQQVGERAGDNPKVNELIDVESDILSTIIKMEQNGIMVDIPLLKDFEQKLVEKLNLLKKDIYQNAGHEFNINSPKQVSEILFVEKALPAMKKTKGGAYSTDEITLRKLIGIDPIIENLLNHREIDKLVSTYLSALPNYVDKDGRIHTNFDQFGAVSGRFASKNPNLQNIPLTEAHGVNIRNTFIAPAGSTFLSLDFSQQELRILAALSGEELMIDSFNNDVDIHKVTASEMFGVSLESVTSEQRQVGKTINFSVIYGISAFGLSERMKIERSLADSFIKKYFEKYKKIETFMNETIRSGKEKGFTETVLGRRRSNEMIHSNNRALKNAAERELFNFVIQGSAADIMKLALNKFTPVLEKYNAKLLLQIHDEYLFEFKTEDINNEKLKKFANEVRDVMLDAYDLGVKFKVDASIGNRWGNMIDYDL